MKEISQEKINEVFRTKRKKDAKKRKLTGEALERQRRILLEAREKKAKKEAEQRAVRELAEKNKQTELQLLEEMLKKLDRRAVKDEVIKVFFELGGRAGLVEWCKKEKSNIKEYYTKILTPLLRADIDSDKIKGPSVQVNIMGLNPAQVSDNKVTVDVTAIPVDAADTEQGD